MSGYVEDVLRKRIRKANGRESMAKYKNFYEIVSQEQISEDVFDMVVDCGEIATEASPGQFVNVFTGDASKLLPRPISICEIIESRYLRLVYRVTGINSGTKMISKLASKDRIEILGPLGNGFPKELSPEVQNIALIGGGIGIPPMMELAKQWQQSRPWRSCFAVLGYRDSKTFLLKDFERIVETKIATDDGSFGYHGTTVDYLKQCTALPDAVMACGPTPMLKSLKEFCEERGILCYLSLEERMACGIGACLACMVNAKDVNPNINISNRRVCKEGPVFLSTDILL